MKKLILLLLLTGITSSIFAQLPSSNTTFGIKGGLNLSNYNYKIESPSIATDANIVKSFNFSGYANVPISPFLSIQAGLVLNGKGSEVESKRVTPVLSGGISGNNKQPGAGDPVIIDPIIIGPIKPVKNIPTVEDNFLSIEIPLNLVAFLKTGPGHFFIGGGPYVAYNVSGKTKCKKYSVGLSIS